MRGGGKPIMHGGEIARSAAADHEACQRAGKVGGRLEPRAQIVTPRRIGDEKFHRVVARTDRLRIGERRGEPLCACLDRHLDR